MAYGESNGHLTDDVTLPGKVKLVTPIRLERNLKNSWICYLATRQRPWPPLRTASAGAI